MSESLDAQPLTNNHILRTLSPGERDGLLAEGQPVTMSHGEILLDTGDPIEYLYFPETLMVSVVTSTASGQLAEAGVIGWEGFAGVEALLGRPAAINRCLIQLPGTGTRIKIDRAKQEFERGGAFNHAVLAFARVLMVQMSQTVLCNRLHLAEQRLAKWFLMCHDRSDKDKMDITHEFAALMLGSSRVSVSQAASQIQERGLIEYKRGRVTVLDREELEKFSCECYQRIKSEYDLFTAE